MISKKVIDSFKVTNGKKFRLADYKTNDTAGVDISKEDAATLLAETVSKIADLQAKLYADDRSALLVIVQAMDAAGKDSAIAAVTSGVNPAGVVVHSFKAPTSTELDHDFMWRTTNVLPERGRIGIFNRSYYEEVLITRVHPNILEHQKLPRDSITPNIYKDRLEDIRSFEAYIARNGIRPIKIFLNVSMDEQRKRFLSRIDEPAKNWKFNMADVTERKLFSKYMEAYEDAIRSTATPEAPWYVVPADRKWFARLVMAGAILDALEKIDPKFPTLPKEQLAELKAARAALMAEGPLKEKKEKKKEKDE
ncbi:polyphosphate kinase 2, PPK2 [Variibacter gotjawalensis]|uniref:Polyphosphate kinase 2, PPK2 n=1 Tax=Variibacter gotjawalensis TaxID=1333996 RepID=A0A0S3PTY2_9BRAD|nr:polyphosphate kinase 2 family protein [Variibacter gotjawalensis]NIK49688.1 PPK2 family polyphosphate:nucleotide phosphotransferase [Variibacter gotjawalensis]RZS45700.1 PPK2 family polyphosphate:nucleotide phosphotransferase [Variibacter gotjawalensis]BAT59371.1 polyphosphate kinase 2, PPK2 [Variibacter gotjawalensis]